MRPHLGNNERTNNFHSPELGITGWHFLFWQPFYQQQWMILANGAISHFRSSSLALNYLAQLEHAYSPEDLFFATVLFNSVEQRGKLISDKRRLVMEAPSKWIGWDDRNRFPPGSSNPSYLFVRPFNALGDFFGEGKLLDWIKENHLDGSTKSVCKVEELGSRPECLHDILKSNSIDNQIIVIPVSIEMLNVGLNLACSLAKNRIQNIIFWALDIEVHETLLEQKHVVYFNPEMQVTPSPAYKINKVPIKALRHKPRLLIEFLQEGFDVWYLDADCVAVRDFAATVEEYTKEPYSADILLSIATSKPIPPSENVGKEPPLASTGIMFLKSEVRTIKFLNALKNVIEANAEMEEQAAIRKILLEPGITFTGIGLWTKSEKYPNEAEQAKISKPKLPDHNVKSSFVEGLTDFFSLKSKEPELDIKIHFLDQLEFINGNYYFKSEENLQGAQSYRIIHASGLSDPESRFRKKELWYLDEDNYCSEYSL